MSTKKHQQPLSVTNPVLTKEWDYEKNGLLSPDDVTAGSNKEVWWKCSNGHEWQTAVSARTTRNNNCPYCSNHRILPGFNDLASQVPTLVTEWNYERNSPLLPNSIAVASNKKVWWKCSKGHEWQATVSARTTKNTKCPVCAGKQVLIGFNDLATLRPDIAAEWDYEKNGSLLPENVTVKSGKRVWWICSKCGNHWQSEIYGRSNKQGDLIGCSVCKNRIIANKLSKPKIGINDLASQNPSLASEWDYKLNYPLTPNDVTVGTQKKVWWRCKNNHSFEMNVASRTKRGTNCPYCSKKKLLSGFNDLKTLYPNLAKEWNYEKNVGLLPENVVANSQRIYIWWKCSKGHEWESKLDHRIRYGSGCPFCSGRNAVPGQTDFATINPDLAKEWNYGKNGNLSPSSFTHKSGAKIWWKCSKGHEWQATIHSRSSNHGCPYCAGLLAIKGETDLATVRPDLLAEWDYDKNAIKPTDITVGSGKKVWWKCSKGHSYKTAVVDRAKHIGCPYCWKRGTSLPEQGIVYYLSQITDVQSRIKLYGNEIDVYLPRFNIGIEYDGLYYHKDKKAFDKQKELVLKEHNIKLFRVIEATSSSQAAYQVIYVPDNLGTNYEKALQRLCKMLSLETNNSVFTSISIDIKRDRLKIRERIDLYEKENSIALNNPELLPEWDYEKNGILTPEMFFPNSEEKVWWKCIKGHSWQATIGSRSAGTGCPYCSGRLAIIGETDFATLYPELVEEWNYERNGSLLPSCFTGGSGKKVWWKCSKGHEWETTITSRTNKGASCPICAGKQVLPGFNDLESQSPDLIKEWNYEKNTTIQPSGVTIFSGKKVWWKCTKGHEWESTIASRSCGRNCPICAGKQVLSGFNDLASQRPDLIKEWNYEKNSTIQPSAVTVSSGKRVWWKCSKGHEWSAIICNRTQHSQNCPFCAGQRILPGINDLATVNPKLAKEWNYEKNQGLVDGNGQDISTPNRIMSSSSYKVWWICDKGHEWYTTVNARAGGTGCPYCSGQKVLLGFNDLASVRPDIAKDWNTEKNRSIEPTSVTAYSSRKVWWTCPKGHDYEMSIYNRTSRGNNCPYCSGARILPGYNDLATLKPSLVKEWNYNKNSLNPSEQSLKSNKKVWWTCPKGHDYEMSIYDRTARGFNCPYCSGARILPGYNDLATLSPSLIKEWDYDKNSLNPSEQALKSNKKAWWKCNHGHSWQATISSRASGTGCPYCYRSNRKHSF